jgi:hypothetical protein
MFSRLFTAGRCEPNAVWRRGDLERRRLTETSGR